MSSRMMTLIAFLQAQNCSNLPGSWRHPATTLDFLTPEYYQRIARVLEEGKIQMAFFDDRLALPDRYTDDHKEAINAGVRAVKLDPCTVLMAMGMATTKLGLGATYSTTYYEPFHVARVFATMDLMLKGRVAWNIVTSLNSGEALNFGDDLHMEHDARYDRADEFMDVVMGHWNTWDDDALILDKEGNRFADADKVHRLDHKGKWFKSRGPFSVPRSPQGPSGADPGRAIRAGAEFRRAVGRSGVPDPPQPGSRQGELQGVQGRRRRRGPRSVQGLRRARLLCLRRGVGGRRDGEKGHRRGHRQADRRFGADLGGFELRFLEEGLRRAVQRRGTGRPQLAWLPATAW